MCNDHGEIGGLRPDGYDSERCPDCNPATVKRYHVTEAGLVEGQALGRINVVLGADHDRVTAERDALQQRLTAADERVDALTQLLREGLEEYKDGDDWIDRVVDALKPAEGGGDES